MRSKTELEVFCHTMRFILSASSWRARMARCKSDRLPPSSLKHPVSAELALGNNICGARHLRLRKHQNKRIQQTLAAFLSLRHCGQLVEDVGVDDSLA